MPPKDLARRGYDAELRRHRENLTRALDETQRVLSTLSNRAGRGEGNLASEARRLTDAVVDVAQHAAAVDAAEQLSFTLEGES